MFGKSNIGFSRNNKVILSLFGNANKASAYSAPDCSEKPTGVGGQSRVAGGGDFRSPRTAPSAPRQDRGLATESGTGAPNKIQWNIEM
jgi:hypothetical protein